MPEYHRETPIAALVAHEDEVIRTGLQTLLAGAMDVDDVTGRGEWLNQKLHPQAPPCRFSFLFAAHDLVRDAVEHVQAARNEGWKLIVMLRHPDNREVAAATELNPDGFLVEGRIDSSTLRTAVQEITDGYVHVPQAMMRGLLAEVRRPASYGPLGINILTTREVETLRLLADGFSNKQIAKRHGISINGVKRHVGNILAKLNCPNRTLAAAEAIRRQII